jgi:L-2-aminoadipate reductase
MFAINECNVSLLINCRTFGCQNVGKADRVRREWLALVSSGQRILHPSHSFMGMSSDALARVATRLSNLPSISLPTDYPRLLGTQRLIEAAHVAELSEQTSLSLLKLALYDENFAEDENDIAIANRPSAFHLLLSAFAVLLHRFTGDTDLVIGSSSAFARSPLILRLSVDPNDPFWAVVKNVQQAEREAEQDCLPYEAVVRALGKDKDDVPETSRSIFRVRFFDQTDAQKENFIQSTSLTSDITFFVTRPPASIHESIAPRISLRILYNSLLFTRTRISYIVDQLSALLRRAAHHPLSPVGSIPLLTPAQRANLPDPTADLNWCDWKGAITDVFSQNARHFPQRTCVVQSIPAAHLDEPQERRFYSYGVIHQASNILAHHLVSGGIKPGDIVMVYAHRSVDLVVAVMGTLKVGAAFSVIGTFCTSGTFPRRQTILRRSCVPSLKADHLSSCCSTSWFDCTQRRGKDQPNGPSFHRFRTSSLRRGACSGAARRRLCRRRSRESQFGCSPSTKRHGKP